MIITERNPQKSLYFLGAKLLEMLKTKNLKYTLLDLYDYFKKYQNIEFKKFIFLGSINKPWISKITKKRKDYKPLIKTLKYFSYIKVNNKFNGGIEIDKDYIKDFLKNFYTITRCDGGFFDYYFSDINQNILFYLHYSGEFKILPLTDDVNDKFLEIIKKNKFRRRSTK